MNIQYANFTNLILQGINGGIPVYPFDVHGNADGNIPYHYGPDVTIVSFAGQLNNIIAHYQDNDSRRICAFTCSDETIAAWPNILIDAATQGLAAWGGKTVTPADALTLAKYLQPERDVTIDGNTIHYGEISLDVDDKLTRSIT